MKRSEFGQMGGFPLIDRENKNMMTFNHSIHLLNHPSWKTNVGIFLACLWLPHVCDAQELSIAKKTQLMVEDILSQDCGISRPEGERLNLKAEMTLEEGAAHFEGKIVELSRSPNQDLILLWLNEVSRKGLTVRQQERYERYFKERWRALEELYDSSTSWMGEGHLALLKKRYPDEDTYVNSQMNRVKQQFQFNARLLIKTLKLE